LGIGNKKSKNNFCFIAKRRKNKKIMAKKLWKFLTRSGVLKKGAAGLDPTPCNVCTQ